MNGRRNTLVITPATSFALATLDEAKAALGIDPSDTSQDAAVQMQIDAVSAAVSNYCNRIFVVQTYRDQLRGHCGSYGEPISTRQWPIVLSETGVPQVVVTENGAALDPSLLEVYPDTGALYRLDGALSPSLWASPLLVIDYQAGYETVPPDLRGATLEWLTARWGATGRDPGLRSETIPDVITQVYSDAASASASSAAAMPAGVRAWLGPYKLWVV